MVVDPSVIAVAQRLLVEARQARSLADAHRAAVRMGLRPPPLADLTARRGRSAREPGMSQRDVGLLLGGYTERQVSRWERCVQTPDLDTCTRLTTLLGLHPASAAWLLAVWHPQTAVVDASRHMGDPGRQ
jgi:hypothetical protein